MRECTCGAWSHPECPRKQCQANFKRDLLNSRMPPAKLQKELWGVRRTETEWRYWLKFAPKVVA